MPLPLRDSEYLYGIHDPGGEHIMLEKGISGWVLVTQALGSDPENHESEDFRFLSDKGLGVMVRLNAGYGGVGTIPFERQYDEFAKRCANFVGASQGAHIWIVGNEMNHPIEWPGADWDWNLNAPRPVSADTVGEQITPNRYAQCYRKVRDAIHTLPGHEQDLVLVGAVAPWNAITRYSGNRHGDWIKYFQDILNRIGADQCDGITLHTYTHGAEPDKIDSGEKMPPPFQRRHYNFRTYRDFMHAIPTPMRKLPVYITETDQDVPWRNEDTGWVQRAYGEIDYWNQNHEQQIRALILYRWSQLDRWSIDGKQGVIEDFRNAMAFGYKPREVVLPINEEEEDGDRKPYRADFVIAEPITAGIAGTDIEADLTIRNTGSNIWYKEGDDTFRVGYHWFDSANHKAHAEDYRTELPRDVEPNQEVMLKIKIGMPYQVGSYGLTIDMVHEGITWFAWRGDQPLAMKVIVLPADEIEEHYFPETEKTVKGPFLDMLLKLGLDTTGYPTSDAIIEDEMMVQYFQWLTLEESKPGEIRVRDTAEFVYDGDNASTGPEQPIAGLPIPTDEIDLGLPSPTIELIAQSLPRHASEMYSRTIDDIQHIVISHTGVRPGISVERLAQAHLQNWPGIACHYLVEADGAIFQTCAITETVDDQRPWVHHGIIVYVAGNFNDAIPTETQLQALTELIAWLLDAHHLSVNSVFGASELIHTQSPGKQWSSGRRWKDVLLGRTQTLLDAFPMRTGRGDDTVREPTIGIGEAQIAAVASSKSIREMQVRHSPQQQQAKTIPKPAIVNIVNQLLKHPTNRYDARSLDQITHIAIHHSATPASVTPQRIALYQVSNKSHQWPGMGYHYFVDQDGTINHTQALELVSNHISEHNNYTVGICLAGDFDDGIPSPMQLAATGHLLAWLMQELNIAAANIWGHKNFPRTTTSCPGRQWDTENRWRDTLIQQVLTAQGNEVQPQDKAFEHYLLLRQEPNALSQQEWEQATDKYIARFRPTFGFSLTSAMMAQKVTVVDISLETSPEEETQLLQAGCWVERIAGKDINETKHILDCLAESGQRFLEP